MAFTLKIENKKIFQKKKFDFELFVKESGFNYGSDDDFYVLEENKISENTAILYNPKKIGRGIFIDFSKAIEGIVEISYNIPTSKSEIEDFVNAVELIEKQYEKAHIFCYEEDVKYTVSELKNNTSKMVTFNLNKLNEFCKNEEYNSLIFTLALWPIVLEDVGLFSTCKNLEEFEKYIHGKQAIDVYYAKPKLYKKNEAEVAAVYVLTEECESVFPIKADGFINLSDVKIDKGFIQFYIFSENRMIENLYDYDTFIQCMLVKGMEKFDGTHILIPSLTKNEIMSIIAEF